MENKKQIITDEVLIKYGFKVTSDVFNDPGGEKHYEKEYNDKNGEKVVVEIIYDYFVGCYLFRTFGLQGWIKTTDKLNRALQILDLDDTNSISDNEVNTNRNELEKHKSVEWSEDSVKKALLLEVLPLFMNGGEADEVVAKLDEVMNNKKYEKQGEQILANSAKTCKIEPKFKIGDWVIIDNNHNSLYQIEKIENYKYYLRHFLGGAMPLNFSDEEDLRFWTIDDAKEGDVIAIGNEYFLFKEKNKNTSSTVYISHCFCNSAKAFRVTNGRDCGEFFPVENGSRVHPATKEQCDLLFQKMKEAGYEWDAKNKKLIKINFQQTEVKDTTKLITAELLEKQDKLEKPTRNQVWDYCSKISHEWWQIAMAKLNTLTDEEKSKYNQFIGFNDFSDTLMNITAGALFQLIDTGKLEYEEGSLLLEKPDDTPMPIETTNPIDEQDSQILANIEPKFKVGDWIACDGLNSARILNVENDKYSVEFIDGTKGSPYIDYIDNYFHMWTIKDARDGDILETVNTRLPFMYKGCLDTEHPDSPVAYCGITTLDRLYVSLPKANKYWTSEEVQPATKAQQNRLLNVMSDKGYFFDSKDKEIKKRNPKVKETEGKNIITGELLINNGFEHRSGIFSDCYDKKFDDESYIDLIQDKKSNNKWILEILKHNDDNDCDRLVETISTIKELQDCLDKMNINLKIKY